MLKKIMNKDVSISKFIMLIILTICIFFIETLAYAAYTVSFSVDGLGFVRVQSEIRVSSISLKEVSNSGLEIYSSEYSKNTIKTGVRLDEIGSTVTYKFTISNLSSEDMSISEIISTVDNNSNIIYELDYKLGDLISAGEVKEINMTYKYRSDITELPVQTNDETVLTFKFERYGLPILGERESWYKSSIDLK